MLLNFQQFVAEEDESKSKEKAPKLSEFEQMTRKFALGTIMHVRIGTGFQAKSLFLVKGENDEWHQIENFNQQSNTMNGKVKEAKFSTQDITGAQPLSKGLKKPGEKVTNVFELAVLPDRSVIEFTHHLLSDKPEVYQKINGLWHKPGDPKGYDSSLFDSQLEHGMWIWKQ